MKLSLVIPCYNEEALIGDSIAVLSDFLRELLAEELIAPGSELLVVDDGSRDKSWEIISRAAASFHSPPPPTHTHGSGHRSAGAVRLSRNRGHQNALIAGLEAARGDFTVTLDADLQDDARVVKTMLEEARRGTDICYGVRDDRATDSLFKRASARFFYRLMRLAGVELIFDHADFRGLSRRAVQALLQFGEVNLFLRGILPQLGFQTAQVFYKRQARLAGETKYPLAKMLAFAWQGVTSFSTFPLKILTFMGFALALPSFALILWAFYRHFGSHTVPGWTSTVAPLMFFSGLQFLALGVVGEYLGKIYLETKRRPRYFVSERVSSAPEGHAK